MLNQLIYIVCYTHVLSFMMIGEKRPSFDYSGIFGFLCICNLIKTMPLPTHIPITTYEIIADGYHTFCVECHIRTCKYI